MAKYSPLQKSKFKFIYAFFGSILGLAGVALGVILVMQPQMLGSNAMVVGYTKTCSLGASCQKNYARGATRCRWMSGGGYSYCCPNGYMLSNNVCKYVPNCTSGLYCSGSEFTQGTKLCMSDNDPMYCCPRGKVIQDGRCVTPFGTSPPNPEPTDKCNKPWINVKCGSGSCAPNEMEQIKLFLPKECGSYIRCVVSPVCSGINPPPSARP